MTLLPTTDLPATEALRRRDVRQKIDDSMASSSSSPDHRSPFGTPVAEKLTRDNFVLWKAQFLPAVRGAKALGILDGSVPEPRQTMETTVDDKKQEIPNPEHDLWVEKDQ